MLINNEDILARYSSDRHKMILNDEHDTEKNGKRANNLVNKITEIPYCAVCSMRRLAAPGVQCHKTRHRVAAQDTRPHRHSVCGDPQLTVTREKYHPRWHQLSP